MYLPLLVCIFVGNTCSPISCGDVATIQRKHYTHIRHIIYLGFNKLICYHIDKNIGSKNFGESNDFGPLAKILAN